MSLGTCCSEVFISSTRPICNSGLVRSPGGQLLLFCHFSGKKPGAFGGEKGCGDCMGGWVVMEKEARIRQIPALTDLRFPPIFIFHSYGNMRSHIF